MSLRLLCAVAMLFIASGAEGARRALLIGINDYTASRLSGVEGAPDPERDWPNLSGAVNDVMAMREMLILFHDFDPRDIVVLTDQSATRTAILKSLHQHLVVPAAKDDVVLFYYAGHGSQVLNSRSGEPDGMDESIVPADSRRGARDIRDKELRVLFNRIIDRGARLTIVQDSCHSASGARGARTRGVAPDLRDVADASSPGPRPENRGALVLSATEDFDQARETKGEDGQIHGSFSWALLHALRDAGTSEPAEETFVRARARMRAATPFQEPVMAGNASARLTPFLGTRAVRRESRPAIVVDRVSGDTVVLHGGWIHGLNAGTELRAGDARLVVTAIHGLNRSEARVVTRAPIEVGTKLDVVRWAPPPVSPLRVWKLPAIRLDLDRDGIEIADSADDAHYVLTPNGRGQYAWVRHARAAGLPDRTAWTDKAAVLEEAARRLRTIHAWHQLESPPQWPSPFRLDIRHNGRPAAGALVAGNTYTLGVRTLHETEPRYVYAFVIDSAGNGILLYPQSGTVENRIDRSRELVRFDVRPPYGPDTYFLLTTDEPVTNPWLLEWDGVRTGRLLPSRWSIEKVVIESVPLNSAQ